MARSITLSDPDLALRLQNKDMTALTLLIDRYQDPLLRYVSYLGCSEPEDSVQETFIKLPQRNLVAGSTVSPTTLPSLTYGLVTLPYLLPNIWTDG